MAILLDTNVLSELMRPVPNQQVLMWLDGQSSNDVFVTAIAQAELYYGLALLPEGRRRQDLTQVIDQMFALDFRDRVWPFDGEAARVYGHLAATRKRQGRPISQSDAQIASIARTRGAALATRNISDFDDCGLALINPWEEARNR